jgi:hypothetical protein
VNEEGVLFFAARSSDWETTAEDLVFDRVPVNVGQSFRDQTTFVAESDGIHFFSFSAGTVANSPALLSLGDLRPGNLNRWSSANQGTDVIYRNVLSSMTAGQSLTVRTATDVTSSAEGAWTSWTGFNLNDFFEDIVAFSAGRDSPYTPSTPIDHPIKMSEVFLNEGGAFSLENSNFVAPEDGIYYFSFSIGQRNGDAVRVALGVDRSSSRDNEMELWCKAGNTDDVNIQSRSSIVQLQAGDVAWISTLHPTVFSDDADLQTTLTGFKYSPSQATSVAWAVHRLFPWSGGPGVGFDPIEFTDVAVNVGDVYDPDTDLFHVAVSGYYYMEFNVGVLGGTSGRAVSVRLVRNGVPEFVSLPEEVLATVVHEAVPTGHDNVGRALVAKLSEGDIIRLVADENSGIFSDTERQTTFLGFLLYEV